ncbi:ABC1 kinase family protein [Youngiibacter multivorans]|uniref:Ubiquinone biosynthesis protein n=1 Tax=Youngiibacter multivorans TaxID=937251 RepID=A0ABS4G529_9CLOT|nr:AarF/UbiB family protein [Youngiibacter multivorans]MBP1919634.1 ubiquinone biosynthesis protein [Youngiibacter multivorans]
MGEAEDRKRNKRFREIVRVLGAYGFGHVINTKFRAERVKKDPENLRLVFEELGPTFIKIGQILSTRPDILPPEYITELSKLQDSAPSFSFDTVQEIIEADLNKDIDQLFISIDKDPVACASVAQVHNAVLVDGTPVIVKVQRPDIENKLLEDMDILIGIVKKAPDTLKDVLLDPVEALEEIKETTKIELDFRNEVSFMIRFMHDNKDIACISVPKPIDGMSTKRVSVQERIEGIKISSKEALIKEGYEPNEIGRKLILSFLYQVFNNGFFHGDPHPGNLIISGRKIYYIDFGIMGVLDSSSRRAFNDLLRSLVSEDITQIVNLILILGIQKGPVDRNRLHDDIEKIVHNYAHSSLRNFQVSYLFKDLFEAARKNNLKLPREFTILLKSLLILEGVLSDLSPDISIMEIASAYIKDMTSEKLVPDISLDLLMIKGMNFMVDSVGIPSQVSTILDNYISGRGKVRVDITNLDEKWVDFNKMVNRMVFALITAAIIIASALIIRVGADSAVRGVSIVGILGFFLAGLLGLWLLISILKSGNI